LEQKGLLVIPKGDVKGNFGPLTKRALIEYQKSVGLPAQGLFGSLTKAKIAEEMTSTTTSSITLSSASTTASSLGISESAYDKLKSDLFNEFRSLLTKQSDSIVNTSAKSVSAVSDTVGDLSNSVNTLYSSTTDALSSLSASTTDTFNLLSASTSNAFSLLSASTTQAINGITSSQWATTSTGISYNGGTVSVGNIEIDHMRGVNDPIPALMSNWRLAFAKVLDGTADAKIMFIGDSTTRGLGGTYAATVPDYDSYPWRVAQLLNSYGIPAAPGLAMPRSTINSNLDNRWTYGTGWQPFNLGPVGSAAQGLTTPAGNLVFTPGGTYSYDKFDVYYLRYSGGGTITCTATGGTPVSQPAVGTSATVKFTVVAATAATTNAVTCSSTGTNYIVAMEPFLSTTHRVRVGNAGIGGTRSAQWATTGSFSGTEFIKAYAPDLGFVSLGINDAGDGVAVASLQVNLSTIITAIKVSGTAGLLTMPPSSGSPYVENEVVYVAMYKSLASSMEIPLIDWYSRLGKSYNSSYMNDSLHCNNIGYWDIAGAITAFITRVY
jgi:lysophospholipase L1-like esterase